MTIEGVYYLHQCGDLIYKPHIESAADIRESPFARGLWFVDPSDRAGAWSILVESLAGGARKDRVHELAAAWKCDDKDAAVFAERVGARLFKDGTAWCATRSDFENLQESPAGFGDTCLEAMAALAKELGYRPSLMWGDTFKGLLTRNTTQPVPAGMTAKDDEHGEQR